MNIDIIKYYSIRLGFVFNNDIINEYTNVWYPKKYERAARLIIDQIFISKGFISKTPSIKQYLRDNIGRNGYYFYSSITCDLIEDNTKYHKKNKNATFLYKINVDCYLRNEKQ